MLEMEINDTTEVNLTAYLQIFYPTHQLHRLFGIGLAGFAAKIEQW